MNLKKYLMDKSGLKTLEEGSDDFTEENSKLLDLKGLEKELSKIVGTKVSLSITKRGGRPKIISQDLVKKSGVMASVFKKLFITSFNSGYMAKDNTFWFSMNFEWEQARGSNGTEIVQAWYHTDTKKWEFRRP